MNTRSDTLSRQGVWEDVLVEDRDKYGGLLPPSVPELILDSATLLHLVDPRRPLDSAEDFSLFFYESLSYLRTYSPSSL